MDRLSIFLTLMSGALITGALVITLFSLGYYSAWGIAISALLGFALAWPSAYLVSRRIKRRDPEWDHRRIERDAALKPSAPEV
ncbi:conserved hypothetical protein [Dinoroseobacter shibae DFL 12 = DSM 16493]|jgi:uncharacterized membrane protein YccC|uniref:Uncharacterized protein n=1 Tax=Dinoroseobacter shibae (strain DSM 16493 / NCIMB 14021 / DFL 12) TaxID=398580 RepID=A8LRA8_DINSH|nr:MULTISPECIES: hypothetical protein [Dinoroseobacter]ABV92558.1 conserved hypothetical protein [Dinoroseobacter shibae DFL 12 = DSM 16493]MDD9718483.1 hypothetical protein [Dinoroseobacter sp. PD6]URF47501.1 hypothetical protein M8008_04205 [Dinoroseobacter shibae]URF51812.1 hypothetical protein M8007_04205 [Dinoroseobacter shibae]